jgi:hypothetical protein
MKISCFGSPRVRGTISVFIFLLSFFVVIVHAPKGLSTLAAAARATSTGASSSADGASEAAYSAAALAAAGLAAAAAKVWTGTSAHTPKVPRHMQPGSNRTGGPQKKGAPAASPIKMGEFENVSSESEKEDYVSEEEDYEAGCAPSALAPVCPPESPPRPPRPSTPLLPALHPPPRKQTPRAREHWGGLQS